MVACIAPGSFVAPSAHSSSFTHLWASEPRPGLLLLYTRALSLGALGQYPHFIYMLRSPKCISPAPISLESTRPTDSSVNLISPLESRPDLKINMPKTDLGSPPSSTCFCSPDPVLNKPHCSVPNCSNQTFELLSLFYIFKFFE